jgi:predicted transcriptional regulator YheO
MNAMRKLSSTSGNSERRSAPIEAQKRRAPVRHAADSNGQLPRNSAARTPFVTQLASRDRVGFRRREAPVDGFADLKGTLVRIAKAVAATVGPACEVVVHEVRQGSRVGNTIIWIENGHVTGRRVGGPPTNLGLEALRKGGRTRDRLRYRTRTGDGRELWSSSVYFHNRRGQLVGALCLNLDVSAVARARAALDDVIGESDGHASRKTVKETFAGDIAELIDAMVANAISEIGKPVHEMTRDEKIAVLHWLDVRGVFLIKRAADRIARALKISRVTVYSYLGHVRSNSGSRLSVSATRRR